MRTFKNVRNSQRVVHGAHAVALLLLVVFESVTVGGSILLRCESRILFVCCKLMEPRQLLGTKIMFVRSNTTSRCMCNIAPCVCSCLLVLGEPLGRQDGNCALLHCRANLLGESASEVSTVCVGE